MKGGASALRCGDVKLMFGKIGFKMYQAPQAKIFLGSAFHASFVQDLDGN